MDITAPNEIQIRRLEQITIEDDYSRHNIRNRVKQDILESYDIFESKIKRGVNLITKFFSKEYYSVKNTRLTEFSAKCELTYQELIIEMLIACMPYTAPQPIQTIVSKLVPLVDMDDKIDAVKTFSELLAVVCETDLFDIIPAKFSDTGGLMVKSNYSLEESTLQFIEDTMFLPPMICLPQEVISNGMSGYLTKNESIILGKENFHTKPQALDVINIMNQVELSLDTQMLAYPEDPTKPLDTQEKIDNHRRMVNSSKKVYKLILDNGNKFSFDHAYDKRGRFYSRGYQVNIQANSYKKAMINLHKKEVIKGV